MSLFFAFISIVGLHNMWVNMLLCNLEVRALIKFPGFWWWPRRGRNQVYPFFLSSLISLIRVGVAGNFSCLSLRADHAVFWGGCDSGGRAGRPRITRFDPDLHEQDCKLLIASCYRCAVILSKVKMSQFVVILWAVHVVLHYYPFLFIPFIIELLNQFVHILQYM